MFACCGKLCVCCWGVRIWEGSVCGTCVGLSETPPPLVFGGLPRFLGLSSVSSADSQRSALVLKRRVQSGDIFACNLPQTVDRIRGDHIPSSNGTSVICSGERLLLIPRGCAFGAFDADEFGRADTTWGKRPRQSKHRKGIKIIARMAFFFWMEPCRRSAPQTRQWVANRAARWLRCGRRLKQGSVGLPGVFSAAGSMVPEPSMMLPPMPFIDVVTTGCEEVEYMATDALAKAGTGDGSRQAVVAPTQPGRPAQVVG